MSWITDIILIFSVAETLNEEDEDLEIEIPESLININSRLYKNGKGTLENLLEYASDRGNMMQTCIYGEGFRYLDIGKFNKIVKAQNWKDRKNV